MQPDPDPEWWSQKGKTASPELQLPQNSQAGEGGWDLHYMVTWEVPSGTSWSLAWLMGLGQVAKDDMHMYSALKKSGLSIQMVTKPSPVSSWSGYMLALLRRLINQAYNVDAQAC